MPMRFHQYILLIFALLLLLPGSSCRKSDYFADEERPVFRDMGEGTGTVTWKKGNDYLLEGLVFVNDGQVLTIEPGDGHPFQGRTGGECFGPDCGPRWPDHRPRNP